MFYLPWSVVYLKFSRTLHSTRMSLLGATLLLFLPGALVSQTVSFAGSSPSVNFGNVNVCKPGQTTPPPCNDTLTLKYNVTGSGTLGPVRVVTQGTPNLDFTLASGSTCSGSVTAGNACVVSVRFLRR